MQYSEQVYLNELEKLAASEERMEVEAPCIIWFAVIAQCQLASRHPSNDGASAKEVRKFLEAMLGEMFPVGTPLHELVSAGWDPDQDVLRF